MDRVFREPSVAMQMLHHGYGGKGSSRKAKLLIYTVTFISDHVLWRKWPVKRTRLRIPTAEMRFLERFSSADTVRNFQGAFWPSSTLLGVKRNPLGQFGPLIRMSPGHRAHCVLVPTRPGVKCCLCRMMPGRPSTPIRPIRRNNGTLLNFFDSSDRTKIIDAFSILVFKICFGIVLPAFSENDKGFI